MPDRMIRDVSRVIFAVALSTMVAACTGPQAAPAASAVETSPAAASTTAGPSSEPVVEPTAASLDIEPNQPISCTPTGEDMEGPYYIPDAPFKDNIAPEGSGGDPLIISGTVFGQNPGGCEPLAEAVIDVWQAGTNGDYDFSSNFLYRGKVRADANGRYQFETILPPPYSGRPSHIHLKISHPDGTLLTTQLYFEGDAVLGGASSSDDPRILALTLRDGVYYGVFDIVLAAP